MPPKASPSPCSQSASRCLSSCPAANSPPRSADARRRWPVRTSPAVKPSGPRGLVPWVNPVRHGLPPLPHSLPLLGHWTFLVGYWIFRPPLPSFLCSTRFSVRLFVGPEPFPPRTAPRVPPLTIPSMRAYPDSNASGRDARN